MTKVRPSRRLAMSSSKISTACGSRPAYGSSRNTTSGSFINARAIERRWVMPRENVRTESKRRWSSSTARSSSRTRASGSDHAVQTRHEHHILHRGQVGIQHGIVRYEANMVAYLVWIFLGVYPHDANRSRGGASKRGAACAAWWSCPHRSDRKWKETLLAAERTTRCLRPCGRRRPS